MSTHNLCFRAKIRKTVYPCKPQFYYIKVTVRGVYITRTCYPNEPAEQQPNKTNSSDTKAPFVDLKLSISNGIASIKNTCLMG